MDRKTFLMSVLSPFLALGADNKVDLESSRIISDDSRRIVGTLIAKAPTFSRYFGDTYFDTTTRIHGEIHETLFATSNLVKESMTTQSFIERNNKSCLKIEVRTLLQLNSKYTYMYICLFVYENSDKDKPEYGMYRYTGTDGDKSLNEIMTKVVYAENNVEKMIDVVKDFSLVE